METRALRYFQAVAECGSYSRGSELLRISQPAVSRTIRKLEEEVGSPLFRRHAHGVSMTEAGRILLERGQLILRQLEQTKAEIRSNESGPAGVLSFAVPPAAGQFLVPPLVERFSAAYPNVSLKIVAGYSTYIREWLVRGQVDLACVHDPLPQRGFEISPLVHEEVMLVGRPGAVPGKREFVTAEDMASLPLVLPSRPSVLRRLLDRWIAASDIAVNIRMEVDDHSITRALVRQGIGFTLLARGAIAAELKRGELAAWPLRPRAAWKLAMLSYANMPRTDIQQAFMRTARLVARELTQSRAWPGRFLAGK
jgi:LysR family transcriptional regulator, nitrogen assimilation regulatory protein